jgi:hypothetical protein
MEAATRLAQDRGIVTNTRATSVEPFLPMTGIWRTLRDYILWSYERGTIQYDVMVTLILFFIFLSPYWINFKDKPMQRNPHRAEVVVVADGQGALIFQIDGSAFRDRDEDHVRAKLSRIIEPISGKVAITKYEREVDGHVTTYWVWARKQ